MKSSADLFKNSLDKAFSNISLNSSTLGDHMKYKQGFQEEKLEGGLADKKTVEDIAKKHKMDVQSINKHLKDGMKVELEHTKDKLKAKEIAMDHLFEDPKYYDKLKKIETKESDDLKLSKNDNEMVQGIVDIINQVKDETNKKQIANNMIKQFKKEKIEVDTDEFLKMCKLKVKEKVETKEATGSGSSKRLRQKRRQRQVLLVDMKLQQCGQNLQRKKIGGQAGKLSIKEGHLFK